MSIIAPYGDKLIDRTIPASQLDGWVRANEMPRIALKHDELIHLWNIVAGCYSPLSGFMTEADYKSVVKNEKLKSGLDWTIPILLHVSREVFDLAESQPTLILENGSGDAIGVLEVASGFAIDQQEYCLSVYGTSSASHPGVEDFLSKPAFSVGGTVSVCADRLEKLRYLVSPKETRSWVGHTKSQECVAFSTRNICHLGHEYLHNTTLESADALAINVITGAQVKGSFLPDVIFDTYEYLRDHYYPEGRVLINNLRLPPIYAGPKEAFLQATTMQNYGFSDFIVGRDHAGTGSYYSKYASQEIFQNKNDLNINIRAISEPRFCKVCDKVTTERGCRHTGEDIRTLNGRDVRRFLIEKRYAELDTILRPEMQELLIRMFEETIDTTKGELSMRENRQIFYD